MSEFTFKAHHLGKVFLLGLVLIISASVTFEQAIASAEKKEDGNSAKESYINVPPFVVTMYHRGRPKGNMTITVLVKIVDSEKRATAQKYLPRLNSAYVIEASRLSHDYFDVKRPVNVTMLGDAFQLVTNRVLKHNQARVLISDIVVYNK